jgi:hypothetical protein
MLGYEWNRRIVYKRSTSAVVSLQCDNVVCLNDLAENQTDLVIYQPKMQPMIKTDLRGIGDPFFTISAMQKSFHYENGVTYEFHDYDMSNNEMKTFKVERNCTREAWRVEIVTRKYICYCSCIYIAYGAMKCELDCPSHFDIRSVEICE